MSKSALLGAGLRPCVLHYFLCKAKQRWHLTPRALELPPETWWDVSGDGEGGSGVRETKRIWIAGGIGSGEVGRLFHFSACPSISPGFIAMKIAPVLINKPLLPAAMGSLLTPQWCVRGERL